jgi:predicted nucleic acid-binding protein
VTVVVDASALVALIASESQGPAVAVCIGSWLTSGREIHAPALARYEVANALARQVADGRISLEDVADAWLALEQLPIAYHVLVDGPGVIDAAQALKRRSAFDAAYLALTIQLDAELWTLDGPLARNAVGLMFPVRLIGA